MLSIDRVLVISQTMKLRQKSTVRISVMIAIIWILAIAVALPDAVSYHLVGIQLRATESWFPLLQSTTVRVGWLQPISLDTN